MILPVRSTTGATSDVGIMSGIPDIGTKRVKTDLKLRIYYLFLIKNVLIENLVDGSRLEWVGAQFSNAHIK